MSILTINWTNAFIVTFLGIAIVFIVLSLLVALLYVFGFVYKLSKNKKVAINKDEEKHLEVVSETEIAAIAMALNLYYEDVYGDESDIITIKRVVSRYSPWNSKIYGNQ